MNYQLAVFFVASALVISACGSGGSSSDSEGQDSTAVGNLPSELVAGTVALDLNDYFLPFSMYVPDSNRGIPEVVETGYGETVVKVGKTFNLIVAEGGDLAAKKAEIADDLMYTNTITEEGEDYIIYKSTIKDSYLDPEFHFYAVKTINGRQFEFRDNKDEGPFAETVASFMMQSVNHIVPNKEA